MIRGLLFFIVVSHFFQLQAQAAAPTSADVVELIVMQGNSFPTLDQFVNGAGFSASKKKELTEFLQKSELVNHKMPGFKVGKNANDLIMAYPFQSEIKLTFNAKPKPHVKIGSRAIDLAGKSAEQIFSALEVAFHAESRATKTSGSQFHRALFPQAHAILPLVLGGAAVATVVLPLGVEQLSVCTPGGVEGPASTSTCHFRDDKSMIQMVKKSGNLKDFRCGNQNELVLLEGKNGESAQFSYDKNGKLNGVKSKGKYTECTLFIEDDKIKHMSNGCDRRHIANTRLASIFNIPVKRLVSCCAETTCVQETGAKTPQSNSRGAVK